MSRTLRHLVSITQRYMPRGPFFPLSYNSYGAADELEGNNAPDGSINHLPLPFSIFPMFFLFLFFWGFILLQRISLCDGEPFEWSLMTQSRGLSRKFLQCSPSPYCQFNFLLGVVFILLSESTGELNAGYRTENATGNRIEPYEIFFQLAYGPQYVRGFWKHEGVLFISPLGGSIHPPLRWNFVKSKPLGLYVFLCCLSFCIFLYMWATWVVIHASCTSLGRRGGSACKTLWPGVRGGFVFFLFKRTTWLEFP
jgi:hypothetical protein